MKFFWCLTVIVLAFASSTTARHMKRQRAAANSSDRSLSQPRIFPGAVVVKKLVLLKFKKVLPISLILHRSFNDGEAELVPVYSTSEIPSDVQFIPTPHGIAGHKDVQAVAVPNKFHQQLQLHGLNDRQGIESLLLQAEESEDGESSLTVAEPVDKEDELLNPKEEEEENDDDQLLPPAAADENDSRKSDSSTGRTSLKHKSSSSSSLKTQTSIEEIPIYLYSTLVTKHQIAARHYRLKA